MILFIQDKDGMKKNLFSIIFGRAEKKSLRFYILPQNMVRYQNNNALKSVLIVGAHTRSSLLEDWTVFPCHSLNI